MLTVYGLKTCDTCRKARKWLTDSEVSYVWLDVRNDGIDPEHLKLAASLLGWEKLINKSSTTWRQLDAEDKLDLDQEKSMSLIEKHPTLLKRPLFLSQSAAVAGFNASRISEIQSLLI